MTQETMSERPSSKAGAWNMWTLAKKRPEYVAIPLVFVVLMLGWDGFVRYLNIESYILPGPIDVVRALFNGLVDGIYFPHLIVTAKEVVFGFFIGAGMGIFIGAVVSQFPLIEKTFFAYVVGIQTIPKIAIAPLIIVWLGFGIESKVFIAAMIVFFPMVVSVIEGFQSADQKQIDLLRAMGATDWQEFRMIKVPNALPFVFVGANVGVVLAILGAVVGEFVGAQAGLGYLILQYNYQLKIANVFAVLAMLASVGIVLHVAVKMLHRKIVFWKKPHYRIDA